MRNFVLKYTRVIDRVEIFSEMIWPYFQRRCKPYLRKPCTFLRPLLVKF